MVGSFTADAAPVLTLFSGVRIVTACGHICNDWNSVVPEHCIPKDGLSRQEGGIRFAVNPERLAGNRGKNQISLISVAEDLSIAKV